MPQAAAKPVDAFVPKMGEFPVTNSAFYKRLVLTHTADRGEDVARTPLDQPVDPFGLSVDPGTGVARPRWSSRPATGVLLTVEQGWFLEGLALGELRHSLCLAPGEVTKVAVVDWRRSTKDSSAEATTQNESVLGVTDDDQSTHAVQRLVDTAEQQSTSNSMGIGQQTEMAAGGGGLLFSMSGSASSSLQLGLAASTNTGSRDVASTTTQDIDRRTAQVAQATRSRRATQVREVTETEQQTATTRVVANYNHMHAMTVQYYEVLQSYSLSTKVIRAERCVFVPMAVIDFTPQTLSRPELMEALLRVAEESGWTTLIPLLREFAQGSGALSTERDALVSRNADLHSSVERIASLQKEAGQRLEREAMEARAAGRPVEGPGRSRKELDDLAGGVSGYLDEIARNDRRIAEIDEALRQRDRLFAALQERRLMLSQQLWMRVDSYTWHQLLGDYAYPDPPYAGDPLGALVSPEPIGWFGNYVAFRWDFPATRKGVKEAEEFEAGFLTSERDAITSRITLPTEGVFAEAVLGQSNSAEPLDISRFWNWQDSPIPILPPELSPVDTSSRARDVQQSRLDLDQAVVALRESNLVTDGAQTSAIVAALQSSVLGNGTIDAAASAGGQAGANAATGAGRAGQRVVDQMKNAQDFVVGLANSEVGKIAAQAVAARSGGISAVGGLLNSARAGEAAAPPAEAPAPDAEKEPEPAAP